MTIEQLKQKVRETGLHEVARRAGLTHHVGLMRWVNGTRDLRIVELEKVCRSVGTKVIVG